MNQNKPIINFNLTNSKKVTKLNTSLTNSNTNSNNNNSVNQSQSNPNNKIKSKYRDIPSKY
jgi:hypothetical protein